MKGVIVCGILGLVLLLVFDSSYRDIWFYTAVNDNLGRVQGEQAGKGDKRAIQKPKSVPYPTSRGKKVLTMTATAYHETGPCTYKEIPAGPGKVAVDPQIIPLGSMLHIEGYGKCRAVDTGKYIKGKRVDVWLPSHSQCVEYGKRSVKVVVYE